MVLYVLKLWKISKYGLVQRLLYSQPDCQIFVFVRYHRDIRTSREGLPLRVKHLSLVQYIKLRWSSYVAAC
jgi:hypothetical protein